MENIQVGLRLRPLNQIELNNFEKNPWTVKSPDSISFDCEHFENVIRNAKFSQLNLRASINFNHVFDENSKNVDIHAKMVEDVVDSSLEGINGTVFMYGQTGSGKTFTMLGSLSDQNSNIKTPNKNPPIQGIISYAVKGIFEKIKERCDNKFTVKCSYLEIYNDLVYDLLANRENLGEPLVINQDSNKEFFIPDTNEETVNSYDEVIEKLSHGEAKRHYASTVLNHVSSRSHTIFRLFIKNIETTQDSSKQFVKEAILNFVDLAGSEKLNYIPQEKTPFENSTNSMKFSSPAATKEKMPLSPNVIRTISKDRFKESQHINKSLFFLTTVISLISQGKKEMHIPYRNSPLTKILKGALGGNSRTKIILCINPCLSQLEQSLNTIRFGLCAKKIQNVVKANCFYLKKKENIVATSTDIKPEKKLNIGLISDQKIRKKLFSGPTIEDLERKNKELISENLKINKKSRKLLRKMKKVKNSLNETKLENSKYKQLFMLFSGENAQNVLNLLPNSILETLENNLTLALDQIKLKKFIKNSDFPAPNDSFRPQFHEILEQKASVYSKTLEIKRRIPCDLLSELEKVGGANKENDKFYGNKLLRISSNEIPEENLLSNVSHLFEEKFEIENLSLLD